MTNPTPLDSFDSFGLSEPVMQAMKDMGYSSPTPIQQQALPLLLGEAQDFIGLASTGTGKTMAFGIPLVEKIDATTKATQALVLSPTRELALQVADQLVKVGKVKGVRVTVIYGGSSYKTQMDGIKRGAHIIVATPGRLVDFITQKIVKLQEVQTVVLDEADEMISMGFKDDLETILKATHPANADSNRAACKTWLFSATMSSEIRRVAATYLENPQTVQVSKAGSTADTIEQIYFTVKNNAKIEVIGRLLQTNPEFYGIIFCQTKMEVAELADALTARGFPADSLHGDKSQQEREATLKKFRDRRVKVIVATDVAARGLDVKDLTHVINHSLPWDAESYVHRIGRTGRNGQKGVAITLVNPEQLHAMRRVANTTKATFTKGVVPSADVVAGLKVKEVMDRLVALDAENPDLLLAQDLVQDLINGDGVDLAKYTAEDFLARFIVSFFPKVFVKKDSMLDYMGDKVPREMLPRDPNDNRFTENRDGGGYRGGGRGGYRGGGFRGGRGGGDRDDRGERSSGAKASFRGGATAVRAERSERAPVERAERSERIERPTVRAERAERTERSERPTERSYDRAPRTEERRDTPGVVRHRSGTKRRFDEAPARTRPAARSTETSSRSASGGKSLGPRRFRPDPA